MILKKMLVVTMSSIIACAYLNGCIPNYTRQELRDHSIGTYEFHVNQNYQYVYQIILDQSIKCWQLSSPRGVERAAQGDLYPERRFGNVRIGILDSTGYQPFGAFDIKSINDNSTIVEAYWVKRECYKVARLAEKWVKEDHKECDFDNLTATPSSGADGSPLSR